VASDMRESDIIYAIVFLILITVVAVEEFPLEMARRGLPE
jgi:hypothetical protein